ncbi:MAG: hypothetical protein ABIQ16_26210 [Polyangiaceae bacterium]
MSLRSLSPAWHVALVWAAIPLGCAGGTPQAQPTVTPPSAIARATCDVSTVLSKGENGCTNGGCHGLRFQAGLDLLSPGRDERLIQMASRRDACGHPLIDAQDLSGSTLARVVDAKLTGASSCGVMMPLGSSTGLSGADLECFRGWVAGLSSRVPSSVATLPFEPTAPRSYVNKVKTLLTGHAATSAEVARVESSPDALHELVAGWLKTPEFAVKLSDFLSVALQQRLEGSLDDQFRRLQGSPSNVKALRANLEESFVRTASDIVQSDRPFTEVATTRRWALTTASLSALAFLDTTAKTTRDEKQRVVNEPEPGLPRLPLSLAYSVEHHVWSAPAKAGCVSKRLDSAGLFKLLLGFEACKPRPNRFDESLIKPADFEDWRFVEIQPPAPDEAPTAFYDLDRLRGAKTVKLSLPREGFFTTPAFFANWETNEGNQFRVTAAQTLIVALGESVSPADPTVPVRLDALAKEHAHAGSTCYGCHQFLDPMRDYFRKDFDFDYRQSAPAGPSAPSFAFHGQVHDGGGIADLATALAQHPKFATGWTQKLCYWANSQPCSEQDPEFQRVAAAFASSHFDFKTLLVELMSSPLVTGATETLTARDNPSFVSITRRQHLCQLLDARLGLEDACGVASNFASLVPRDDFARGSAEPVMTAVTGLSHYAATEKLCSRLAIRLVARGDNRRFSPASPQLALNEMVEQLMGLDAQHPQHDSARSTLGDHYQQALARSNPATALRSAFIVACMSPQVTGLGL